ncbi:hypothetical protein N9S81_00315, partial [bacterium]|nr:hypothetical protein [bacterium]
MARLLAVDDVSVPLRNTLLKYLSPMDEAVLLPQATQSQDSASFKNVCFRLCATQETNSNIIPLDLFTGVSIARISSGEDVKLLQGAFEQKETRAALLQNLVDSISSEMNDDAVTIGPQLDCGEDERDLPTDNWTAGFDSPSAFVGIFSAQNSHPTEPGTTGQSRVYDEYYLVCKAGGGLAGSTFHSRLRAELAKGKTLDQCLDEGGIPGACALRRVSTAGQRNRGRILAKASCALGLKNLSTVGDTPARNKEKIVVADVDVVVNSLKKLETSKTPTFQLACCTDLSLSKGACFLSNASDGLTLLLSSSGDMKPSVSNETFASLPFFSVRIKSSRDLAGDVVRAHKSSSCGHA